VGLKMISDAGRRLDVVNIPQNLCPVKSAKGGVKSAERG
jgi:hypothetical protein